MVNSDEALVLQCLKGERQAYDVLVRKYQSAAFGLAFSFVRNADDAAELVQEAFIRVYTHLEQLKEPAKFGGWFRTIVANRAKKWQRQKREQVALMSAAEELGQQATQQFEQNEYRLSIWEQVHKLDEIYRVPVTLFYGSGLSYEEIASFLDVPISTVRGRLQKARQQLKDVLAEDLNMKPVDVADQVQEEICKIARAEIYQEIEPGKDRHLVLFLDLPAVVSVEQGDTEMVRIAGHKVAVGENEKKAQAALDNLKLLYDEVDDWVEAGQHEGERFWGSNIVNGQPTALVSKSGGKVTKFDARCEKFMGCVPVESVFPHVVPEQNYLDQIRANVPRGANRVSVLTEKMIDIRLPKSAVSSEVLEGMWINNSNNKRVHGPVGRVVLQVTVPAGFAVTIVGGEDSVIDGVLGNVMCINGKYESIRNVQGSVTLLHSFSRVVQNIAENVDVFEHMHDNNSGLDKPSNERTTQIENVQGGLTSNTGYIHLKIRAVNGELNVQNRMGNTRLEMANQSDKTHCRVQTVSGNISAQISKEVMKTRSISGAILVGTMDYRQVHDVIPEFQQANNQQMRYFSTVTGSNDHWRDADIFLSSESGHLEVKHFED